VRALIKTSQDHGYEPSILKEVMHVNDRQRVSFTDKIMAFYDGNVKGKRFAIWGLAFKPNTDDMREAPSIYIINTLTKEGAFCKLFDPKAMEVASQHFEGNQDVSFAKNQYEALEGADALILVTEWLSFREPDFERMKSLMKAPVVFDGRNQYNPKTIAKIGFNYICIGRPV
jgi:UDPglucose 6-dehydrogenase